MTSVGQEGFFAAWYWWVRLGRAADHSTAINQVRSALWCDHTKRRSLMVSERCRCHPCQAVCVSASWTHGLGSEEQDSF